MLIAPQANSVLKAFTAERKFIMVTTRAKKPDIQSQTYMETLKGIQETMGAVDGVRVANRGSQFANHLAAVADGIPMLGWVTVDPKPNEYIKEMMDTAQYYGNRVIKDHKEKLEVCPFSKCLAKPLPAIQSTSNGSSPTTPLARPSRLTSENSTLQV